MVEGLISQRGLRRRLLSFQDGERRLTNLLHTAEVLHQVSAQERFSPEGLLHWMAVQRKRKAGDELYELRLEDDKAPELHLKDPALVARLGFVGETPPIPEAGICARPGLPADALARVKKALLAMKPPEHAAVLKDIYNIDGFVDASDADYQPVRDAVALMGLTAPK